MFTPAQLVDALTQAGVSLIEEPGWQTRNTGPWTPVGTVWHHTASNRNGGPHPELRHCIDDILCNALVGRDGTWHLIAFGKTSHAGWGSADALARARAGRPPAGDHPEGNTVSGNPWFFGIEAENDGIGEPWPRTQLVAIRNGIAALHALAGWPAATLIAHREWTNRKIDPTGIDMPHERALLAAALTPPAPAQEDSAVARRIIHPDKPDDHRKWPYVELDLNGRGISGRNGGRLVGMKNTPYGGHITLGKKAVELTPTPQANVGVVVIYEDMSTSRIEWA